MTATKAVSNDQQKQKPTAEQTDTYTRRENELRQRFLKGVLETDAILDGLQKLMEMTRGCINCNVQPEIPSWADTENPIIQHLPCGMIDPSKLVATDVFKEGEEYLEGEEFLVRAQKIDGSMNACAFDFYSKPENWKYLPKDVDVIVFPKTVFRSSRGRRCVRFICRRGAEWDRLNRWLVSRFGRLCRVASLAS